MGHLVIDFTYFFLLIRRHSQPLVVLPDGHLPGCTGTCSGCYPHRTTWTVNGTPQPLTRATRMEFLEAPAKSGQIDWEGEGKRLKGQTQSVWPDSEMLLDLKQTDGRSKRFAVRSLKKEDAAERCNVELILPRGRFQALGTVKPASAFIQWQFTVTDNDKPKRQHAQYMSDLMQFRTPIRADRRYALKLTTWKDGNPTVRFAELARKGANITLTFENDDDRSHRELGRWNGELREYRVLYSFLNVKKWEDLPLPQAAAAILQPSLRRMFPFSGEDRPICGGAQGDGGDDPPVDP